MEMESQNTLRGIRIPEVSRTAMEAARKKWDSVAKPIDGFGDFEEVLVRIAGMKGSADFSLKNRSAVVFCADNGIVAEGVSQSSPAITEAVARKIGEGNSNVNILARKAGCDVVAVDVGVKIRPGKPAELPGVRRERVGNGTHDFLMEPAMSEKEALRAISVGMNMAETFALEGRDLVIAGEMGIGNTSSSSAMSAAMLSVPAWGVTGKGAGLSEEGLIHKIAVIQKALHIYSIDPGDTFEILRTFGGFDIGAMTGFYIGAALYHLPVVLDGLISLTAALCAERLCPGVRDYMLPSHAGREIACLKLLDCLKLKPLILGDMALGEGTGAMMLLPLLDMALELYDSSHTFEEMQITAYTRYEKY